MLFVERETGPALVLACRSTSAIRTPDVDPNACLALIAREIAVASTTSAETRVPELVASTRNAGLSITCLLAAVS